MIVVIGASRGLGAEVTKRLADWDYDVVLAGRSVDDLNEVLGVSGLDRSRAHVEPVDLARPESVDDFVKRLAAIGLPLRAIIVTAAGYYKGALMDEPQESVDTLIATTFAGTVRLELRALRELSLAAPVDIINVTSIAAGTNLDTSRSSVMHVVTKAALQTFGVASGRELAEKGIRVCSIAPGTYAKSSVNGIPRQTLVDCIEFVLRLPRSTWMESMALRPTGLPDSD